MSQVQLIVAELQLSSSCSCCLDQGLMKAVSGGQAGGNGTGWNRVEQQRGERGGGAQLRRTAAGSGGDWGRVGGKRGSAGGGTGVGV